MKRIGDIAAKVLADCAAAMERKASGASKAGVNLDIGCPLVPVPAAEATEGDLPGGKAASPRSQAVGERGTNGNAAPKAMRVPSHRGPPGSEGKSGRGFRNQADAGEVFSEALAREPTRIRFGVLTGGFPYVRASVKE